MGLKEWLVPQEKQFFDLLEKEAKTVLKGAEALNELFDNYGELAQRQPEIKEIEHNGDRTVHEIYEALNRTFITPIDREDISAIASRLDDVLDFIDATTIRLQIYKIPEPTVYMKDLAAVILKSCRELNRAMAGIRNLKDPKKVEEACIEINRLENRADTILRDALVNLFEGKDVILILKTKEIYEFLETATDRCEDVANIVSDVIMKNR